MVFYRGGEEVPRQEDSTDQRCVHVIGLYYTISDRHFPMNWFIISG